MECKPITIYPEEINQSLTEDGMPLVTVKIKYPRIAGGTPRGTKRINKYYKRAADTYHAYVKRILLPLAKEDWKYRLDNSFPFHPFDAVMTYSVTFNDGACLSLYWENYEFTGGAHGNTTRHGDTWAACTGWPIELRDFFPKGARYRKILTDNAIAIAAQQIIDGTGYYFDNYPRLIRKNFRDSNFYIKKEGVAIFYPQYAIAPYSSGIPEFVYQNRLESKPELVFSE